VTVATTVAMIEVLAAVGVDVRVGVAVAAATGVLVFVGVLVRTPDSTSSCTNWAHWPTAGVGVATAPVPVTGGKHAVFALGTVIVGVTLAATRAWRVMVVLGVVPVLAGTVQSTEFAPTTLTQFAGKGVTNTNCGARMSRMVVAVGTVTTIWNVTMLVGLRWAVRVLAG